MKLQIWRTIWPVAAVAAVAYGVPAVREGQTQPCGAFAVRIYLQHTGGVEPSDNQAINAIIYGMGDRMMSARVAESQNYRKWPPELACSWLYWQSLLGDIPGAR